MRRSTLFYLALALGLIAIALGIYIGTTSRQVMYGIMGRGTIAHYLTGQGTGYLQVIDSHNLYVVYENDFTPKINGAKTFLDGDSVSFIYELGDGIPVNARSTAGTHLVGTALKIVEITAYNNQTMYTIPTYTRFPHGYYLNNWLPGGAGLILFGCLLFGGSFLLPRKRLRAEMAEIASATMSESFEIVPLSDELMGNEFYTFEGAEDANGAERNQSYEPYSTGLLRMPQVTRDMPIIAHNKPEEPYFPLPTNALRLPQVTQHFPAVPKTDEPKQEEPFVPFSTGFLRLPQITQHFPAVPKTDEPKQEEPFVPFATGVLRLPQITQHMPAAFHAANRQEQPSPPLTGGLMRRPQFSQQLPVQSPEQIKRSEHNDQAQ